MKKITWLLAAILPLVILFSCQKEVASSRDVNMLAKGGNGGGGNDNGCGPNQKAPSGAVSLVLDPLNPKAGDNVTACLTLTSGSLNYFNVIDTKGTVSTGDDATYTGVKTILPDGNEEWCVNLGTVTANSCGAASHYIIDAHYNNGNGNLGGVYCAPSVNNYISTSLCILVTEDEGNCDLTNPLTLTGAATIEP
jgi:hypothetical protein